MDRRAFLELSGISVIWYLTKGLFSRRRREKATADRLVEWPPNLDDLVEWRYAAGRIVDGGQDFGFLLSISYIRFPGAASQKLLVQRQNFAPDQAFAGNTYTGELTYDPALATYTFLDEADQELARWQWDQVAQIYKLTVTTVELTLENIVLRPQGDLIPEGGDGEIRAGRVGSILIDSDYHADWTAVEINGDAKGTARVDMQGLRPALIFSRLLRKSKQRSEQWNYGRLAGPKIVSTEKVGLTSETWDPDHRWFAIAAELEDGASVWISAWRIEDLEGPLWALTIARGSGTSWQVVLSLTEESSHNPLQVSTLAWQDVPPQPGSSQITQRAGSKWRLTAPDDALNLEISVPPGQFAISGMLAGLGGQTWMGEAVGIDVTGSVLGTPIRSVKVALAESTVEFQPIFMPAVFKGVP